MLLAECAPVTAAVTLAVVKDFVLPDLRLSLEGFVPGAETDEAVKYGVVTWRQSAREVSTRLITHAA